MWEGVVYLIPVLFTQTFSHSNWSPTSGAEISGTSLLDLQVKQAMGDQALILIR